MTVVLVDVRELRVICVQALALIEQARRGVLFVVLWLHISLVESCQSEDGIQDKWIGHAVVEGHVLPDDGVRVVSRDPHVSRSRVVVDKTKLILPTQTRVRLSDGIIRRL